MDQDKAIVVEHISKSFKIYIDKSNTMMESLLFWKRKKYENRQVLEDISFTVDKGEAVGLIGHNGCGKSTTLKMLSKILYPDSGTIQTNGRVVSLLELGAGFHPDMSGRENIYSNASIFGLTRAEIDKRLENIIFFSELEEFIDNPVRTYSSGMYMRLAFSVAINVDADILLIDEILAVGDVGFQKKCFDRLKEIKANGTAIVIVSHAAKQIERICDRVIWIHKGRIRTQGVPSDINSQYLDYMSEKQKSNAEAQKKEEEVDKNATRWGNGDAVISEIKLLDKDGKEATSFWTDDPVTIQFNYDVKKRVENAVFGIGLFRSDGLSCYGTNTEIDKIPNFSLTKSGMVRFQMEAMTLLPGDYVLEVALVTDVGIPVDYFTNAKKFKVYAKLDDIGIARMKHKWEIDGI
ncbi:MAG: ABC transporter ATP-binding protein [Lachnospiraceae bacterium]|nr:ABC transporter ATP-binding protein [Lachnospiraceae bacterium]